MLSYANLEPGKVMRNGISTFVGCAPATVLTAALSPDLLTPRFNQFPRKGYVLSAGR